MHRSPKIAVYAVLALLLGAGVWYGGGREQLASIRTRIAIDALVTAADDFPDARFTLLHRSAAVRAGLDHKLLKTRSANVLRVSSDASAVMRGSASAAAYGIAGDWDAAVRALEAAVVAAPNDADLWSDLAAARYERSTAVEGLLSALVAADRSRRLDPGHASALFNRALILERLGLLTVAEDAWRECIDTAGDASLIADARRRLAAIERDTWADARVELERAAEAGDVAVIERIVARFPQEARTNGELTYLNAWAYAHLKRDVAAAAQQLRIARVIGAALRKRGETLLAEAVESIDRVAGDEGALRTLATAQVAYDEGRYAFEDFKYAEGERLFRESAAGFARERSPMELVARMYEAAVVLDQGRADEAHDMLASLAEVERKHAGHRANLGYVQWMDGRCELFRSRWDDSARALGAAHTIFHELGEASNAAFMSGILTEIFERAGRVDVAWAHCANAWRGTSARGNEPRLQAAIGQGVGLAMRTRKWDIAASLIEIELAVPAEVHSPAIAAVAHRRHYVVEHELKDFESRDIALMRARIAAAHAGDEELVQLAEIDQAEALVAMESDPRRAVAILTRGIDFVARTERRIFLVDLLWNRGRANAAAGDLDAAWADFATGIDELERQRGAIAAAEMRARFFDSGERLFDDAIRLLIRRGDVAAAFHYADRARGRLLLDPDRAGGGPPPASLLPALTARLANAALIEYVVLDDEVVIFCVRNGALTMHRVPVEAEALRAKIDQLQRRMDDGTGSGLYELLIAPVADEIASASSLIVVADDELQRVPFGALRHASARRYLAQSHAIAMAPSAALLTSRVPRAEAPRTALLIGNAAADEAGALPSLPNVDREIAAVRTVYHSPRVLMGPDATVEQFAADAASYDAIHFAGHGASDENSLTASLVFSNGRMYMSDIAQLRLPRAPLVVLGACGTLRGRATGMEGMPSVARSFLMAGASTVIGTLRDIDDTTARQMLTAFHRSIGAGVRPAEALRQAQLDAIARGGDAAEPRNWAPYVVYTATP